MRLEELKVSEFEKVRPLFEGRERAPVRAIIAGNCPSQVFVDDAARPTAVFMWNEFRYSYLAGDAGNFDFRLCLSDMLQGELLPQARESHDPTLVVYPYQAAWHEMIPLWFWNCTRYKAARTSFKFDPARFRPQAQVPAGLRLQRIDQATLERSGAEIAPALRLFWHALGDFLAKGVGFCVLDGDDMVSSCLSAFAAEGQYEVDIQTHPEYRRQGLAALTASAFVAHCLEHGWEPVWECWDNNTASIALAEKVGFVRVADLPVCFVDLRE
jgi:RimJ/RimL family protein N-acetyltransferase